MKPACFAALDGREITRFDGRQRNFATPPEPRSSITSRPIRERIISSVADPNIALSCSSSARWGFMSSSARPGLILPGVAAGFLVLLALSDSRCYPSTGSARACSCWRGIIRLEAENSPRMEF